MIFVNKVGFHVVFFCFMLFEIVFGSSVLPPRPRSTSVNESPARNIDRALRGPMTSPAILAIQSNVCRLEESPGDTKKTTLRNTTNTIKNKIINPDANAVDQNNQIVSAYSSPDKDIKRMALAYDFMVGHLPEEEQQEHSVVDLHHVLDRKVITDAKTGKGKAIPGAHDITKWPAGSLLKPCVLSQHKEVLASFGPINDKQNAKKTFKNGINADAILVNKKNGIKIARKKNFDGAADLIIYQDKEGSYFGTCHKKEGGKEFNAALATQYHLLVVDVEEIKPDGLGLVVVATLGNLNPTNHSEINDQENLMLASMELETMMKKVPLEMFTKNTAMSDITKDVEVAFQSELRKRGYPKDKLPGSIFAVKKLKTTE